ncbi:hypothetical protein MXB_4120 [Myxobolus squamalis]|nr:hypothetical protein MXB_4120 [Myxobolus squamalis]
MSFTINDTIKPEVKFIKESSFTDKDKGSIDKPTHKSDNKLSDRPRRVDHHHGPSSRHARKSSPRKSPRNTHERHKIRRSTSRSRDKYESYRRPGHRNDH